MAVTEQLSTAKKCISHALRKKSGPPSRQKKDISEHQVFGQTPFRIYYFVLGKYTTYLKFLASPILAHKIIYDRHVI